MANLKSQKYKFYVVHIKIFNYINMNYKNNLIIYLCYSLVGAILLPLLYYFSINGKTKLCALLPALPILGLVGLFLTNIFNNKSINIYIVNHIISLLITISLYLFMYILYYFTKNIGLSFLISFLLWLIIIKCFLFYSKY